MRDFLRIFCLFGLPVFAFTALLIWRPADPSNPGRSIADPLIWPVFALGFCLMFCLLGPAVVPVTALVIWRFAYAPKSGDSVADRIAWTVFAFGVCLMFNMALYARALESDGDFRTWETIRLHSRVFLALAAIPVAGPLLVVLYQATRTHRPDR